MILFNLKIAWRNIWKNKVFSAINMVGLALSMACCLVISVYVWNELSYDSFHQNAPNIYRVTEKQNQAGTLYDVAVTPGPLAPTLKKDFPEILRTVRFASWGGFLKNGANAFEENNILLTENSTFNMFSFHLLKGNPATALKSPSDIIITETIALKYFGKNWRTNASLLGQVFTLNNEVDFKLAGIVKDPPPNSSIRFDILLPIDYLFSTDEWSNKWNSNNYHTYLQIKPSTNIPAFEEKIRMQLHVYNAETQDLLQLQPLKKQYLHSRFDFHTDWGKRSNIINVQIFSGVGLLLLIIACVNFVNLSTARSLKRSREVGVRKVNGASRKQLIFQFLGESVLIAFLSALISLIIIRLALPSIEKITGQAIAINFSNPVFAGFCLLFIIIIGLIAGIYPAFILSSFKPVKIFKTNNGKTSSKSFWQGLVVFQFAVAIALMICTSFMYRQLAFVRQKDLGFNTDELLSIRLKGAVKEKALAFKRDVQQLSYITAAAPATMSMVNVDNSSYMEWEGMQARDKFLVTQANVVPDFIPALGIQLLNGNNFSEQKTNDTASYIINETAVKRMGYTVNNAIGKKVTIWGAKGTVIGVVKDFNFKSLNVGVDPFIFRYQPLDNYFNLFVKIAPAHTAKAIQQLQSIYKKYDPAFAMDYCFVNEAINNLYVEDARIANLILLFACLTVFVACLGLFGLTVFAAEQRVREIGIRKVLGASLPSLANLLSKDFLKLVLMASVIATPVAWYTTGQWLQNFAYRIGMDWKVFVAAGSVVLFISYITISIQTIKAAMVSPVKSLRSE